MPQDEEHTWGAKLARLLRLAEEAVYILIGVLLVFAAVGLLGAAGVQFAGEVRLDAHAATLSLLDTLLLVLMLAEILLHAHRDSGAARPGPATLPDRCPHRGRPADPSPHGA